MTDILTPRRVLWLALATVLAASAVHVAGTFSTLEHGGALPVLASMGPYVGVLAALAVDLGMIAMTWAVGERRRAGRDTWDLWVGVGVFAGLSALANFDHGLTVLGAGAMGAAAWSALDWYTRVKVVLLSASLPLLAVWLTRVVETAVHEGQDTDEDADEDTPTEEGAAADPSPADVPPGALVMEWDNGDRVVVPAAAYTNGHVAHVPVPPAPRKVTHTTSRPRAAVMPEDYTRYRDVAKRVIPEGAAAQEADRSVGEAAGVSAKTVQRDRRTS